MLDHVLRHVPLVRRREWHEAVVHAHLDRHHVAVVDHGRAAAAHHRHAHRRLAARLLETLAWIDEALRWLCTTWATVLLLNTDGLTIQTHFRFFTFLARG